MPERVVPRAGGGAPQGRWQRSGSMATVPQDAGGRLGGGWRRKEAGGAGGWHHVLREPRARATGADPASPRPLRARDPRLPAPAPARPSASRRVDGYLPRLVGRSSQKVRGDTLFVLFDLRLILALSIPRSLPDPRLFLRSPQLHLCHLARAATHSDVGVGDEGGLASACVRARESCASNGSEDESGGENTAACARGSDAHAPIRGVGLLGWEDGNGCERARAREEQRF